MHFGEKLLLCGMQYKICKAWKLWGPIHCHKLSSRMHDVNVTPQTQLSYAQLKMFI
jgi:hypothetical protein